MAKSGRVRVERMFFNTSLILQGLDMTQKEQVNPLESRLDETLRSVDLNLLPIFDAVMQEHNITRAAQTLRMSQPAVSNAVSRLKVMFNDELFVRNGRGIKPTQRARQLFGPIRQAIQLIKNELPTSIFLPESSTRVFRLAICSPSDIRFAPQILKTLAQIAPHLSVLLETELVHDISRKLRYREVDFVIDYFRFNETGFCSTEICTDELVVVVSKEHPRIGDSISAKELQNEGHAVLKHNGEMHGYSEIWYKDGHYTASYQGVSLSNILYVVGKSELLTIAPRWMLETGSYGDNVKVLTLPQSLSSSHVSAYLSWHASAEKDKGHLWFRDQLLSICGNALA